MTTELATINYNDARALDVIRKTVAKDATDAEFQVFIQLCKATGLNPYKKEIWFIKAGGRAQIMTGIHGFFEIANNNPAFDGHESGLITKDGEMVSAAYPKDDFIGAWSRVYRKDRRVHTESVAMLKDYDKQQSNWKTMKRVMIIKCAEAVALRKSFPQQLNGLYAQEEMPTECSMHGVATDVSESWPDDYVIQNSPNIDEIQGKMICEIDPEFFTALVNSKELAAQIDERDLEPLRAYYKENFKIPAPKAKTKTEQNIERMKRARELDNDEGGVREAVKEQEAA